VSEGKLGLEETIQANRQERPPARWKTYGSISAATVFWASNAVAVKFVVGEIPQFTAAFLRVTLAAMTLVIVFLLRGERFSLSRQEQRDFLKLSLWGIALSFLFFTLGLKYTSISHVVFIGALVPMAVLLLARFYGLERITPVRLAGLLVSMAGILFLSLDQAGGPEPRWIGDLLASAGVWCFAFYTVQSKRRTRAYSSLQFNTYMFLGAALWFFPLLVAELLRLPWGGITWSGWASLLYSATVGSAGSYLAYYYSLRLLAASQASAFHYLQPVLATAFGIWFFHESFTARFALGAALILAGVFVAERS
jgi:drug/metabolite transporter (DMT)-like permease